MKFLKPLVLVPLLLLGACSSETPTTAPEAGNLDKKGTPTPSLEIVHRSQLPTNQDPTTFKSILTYSDNGQTVLTAEVRVSPTSLSVEGTAGGNSFRSSYTETPDGTEFESQNGVSSFGPYDLIDGSIPEPIAWDWSDHVDASKGDANLQAVGDAIHAAFVNGNYSEQDRWAVEAVLMTIESSNTTGGATTQNVIGDYLGCVRDACSRKGGSWSIFTGCSFPDEGPGQAILMQLAYQLDRAACLARAIRDNQ